MTSRSRSCVPSFVLPCVPSPLSPAARPRRRRSIHLLAASVAMFVAASLQAAILTVYQNGSGDHTTIQAAIDAANSGDTILIGPGAYDEFLDTGGKTLTLRGVNGYAQTIVDPIGTNGTLLTINDGESGLRIENLTFRNGRNASMTVIQAGSEVTFVQCRFLGGIAAEGSAISVNSASPTFENCQFLSNQASSKGGAINAVAATIVLDACAFNGNQCSGSEGGAIHATNSTLFMDGCSLVNNQCNSGDTSVGGAIWASGVQGSWTNCVFQGNQARSAKLSRGGDCYLVQQSSITIQDTQFADSEAGVDRNENNNFTIDAEGGALWCGSATALLVSETTFSATQARGNGSVTNTCCSCSYFTGNVRARGGAIYSSGGSSVTLATCQFLATHATSAGSGGQNCNYWRINCNAYGGALWINGASPFIEDCVFDGTKSVISPSGSQTGSQIAYGGAIFLDALASPTLLNLTFDGCQGGRGSAIYSSGQSSPFITGTVFISNGGGTGGGYYSQDSSPSFTACLFQSNSGGAVQSAGSGGYFPQIGTSTFCGNSGGDVNGSWYDNGGNAFLSACGADCDGNGLDDAYEVASGAASDCNGNGVLDSCELAAKPELDCDGNGVIDVCESSTGNDCDGDGVLDACEADCNTNGLPDDCEILAGNGTDCDGDGVLDSCQIAADPSIDCNGNGLPDSCDEDCDGNGIADNCQIAADPGLDCNLNGVLDACELIGADLNNDGVLDECQGIDFAGISIEIAPITGVLRDAKSPLPLAAVCYRIYALLGDPDAQVLGIYGSPSDGPLVLTSDGGFFNDPLGGNTASERPCDPAGNFPELQFDSFLTVGGECSGISTEQNIGLDFSGFNTGGSLIDNDGIVLVAPGAAQAFAGVEGRVLVAQLTSMDGSLPDGEFNLVGANADGSDFIAFGMSWSDPPLVDCNGNGQQDAFDIGTGLSLDCNVDGIPDDCQTSNPNRDCNGNGTPDWCDITAGVSEDDNNNGVPDECECEGDLNGDSLVNVDDILIVILEWGEPGGPGDANGDGIVDALDLSVVITGYGVCL